MNINKDSLIRDGYKKMETIENPVIGEKITFISTSKQSGGEKTLMEIHLGPKGGNPLHYHKRFSETFKIKEGELNVQLDKAIEVLKPGDTVTAQILQRHRFFNTSGKSVVFLCELTPASEGFENVLRIGCGLARDGKAASNGMPKNIIHMAILMNIGEGYFVGIFSILEKFFRILANTRKAKQTEKLLREKYCT
jgi:mannose-6-phosphate isomerase-like protein (cupin superfamily)